MAHPAKAKAALAVSLDLVPAWEKASALGLIRHRDTAVSRARSFFHLQRDGRPPQAEALAVVFFAAATLPFSSAASSASVLPCTPRYMSEGDEMKIAE